MKILFFLLFSLSALAGDLYYLNDSDVDLSLIPEPPAVGSLADTEDLEEVLNIQEVRTEAECKRASIEAEGYSEAFFGGEYGPLSTEEAKKLHDFHERLYNEVNYFSRMLKQRFSRVRPFDRDPRIVPCIPLQRSNSYPSGHATAAYVTAHSYALIYPEKALEFYEREEVIGHDRVLGGVHHPLDVMAGRALGQEIFRALMNSDKFQRDLQSLK